MMPWELNGNNANTNPPANNFLGTRNTATLIIKTNTANAPANLEEVMRITPSSATTRGFVGIGTTAPAGRLHVDDSRGENYARRQALEAHENEIDKDTQRAGRSQRSTE
jgi:hypothetical protein